VSRFFFGLKDFRWTGTSFLTGDDKVLQKRKFASEIKKKQPRNEQKRRE
jgi:hypothetical protein